MPNIEKAKGAGSGKLTTQKTLMSGIKVRHGQDGYVKLTDGKGGEVKFARRFHGIGQERRNFGRDIVFENGIYVDTVTDAEITPEYMQV